MIEYDGPDQNPNELLAGFEENVDEERERAVRETERRAKVLVPVDTGRLQSTIDVDIRNYEVTAGGERAPYAIPVHEGTVNQEPQPFLENAALEVFERSADRLRS